MIYNFSEVKDQNEQVEQRLQGMKEEYRRQEMSEAQLGQLREKMEAAKMKNRIEYGKRGIVRAAAAAAVLAGSFVLLPNTSASIAHAMEKIPVIGGIVEAVTFRNYSYKTERNMADVDVPQIQPTEIAGQTADMEVSAIPPMEIAGQETPAQAKLAHTAEKINEEIRDITDGLIAEFETNLKQEQGYQDISVKGEVLMTTPDYFTLKLACYQGAGSGYAWNYYYTIDLRTGERLALRDLFAEDADYITPISENIKGQMQAQMDADENVYFWLNDELEEWNFKAITDETSFYLNEKGNVVIGFNEGDVAPMYMGTVEFEIPAEVLEGIRK